MASQKGDYRIEEYEVIIHGEKVKKKRILYLSKSGDEISRETYSENITSIPDTFIDKTDPVNINTIAYTINASEDWGGCEGVTDRFLKRGGGSYTNITPFVMWSDCLLIGLTLSSREEKEWTASIFVNGEEVDRLSSDGLRFQTGNFNIYLRKCDQLSFFVNGENVMNPGVEAYFTSVLNSSNRTSEDKK